MGSANVRYFNGTKEDIRSRNLFVGISVGVKPLDEGIARQYLDFALRTVEGDVAVLVADYIAKYNHQIFDKFSEERSVKKALREGKKNLDIFANVAGNLPSGMVERVRLLRWRDITDSVYESQLDTLQQFFAENEEFQEELLGFINKYLERRPRNLSRETKLYLCEYLLSELPPLLDGIRNNNQHFNAVLYPTFVQSGMSELATAIMQGKRFPELGERLEIKGDTILSELYIA